MSTAYSPAPADPGLTPARPLLPWTPQCSPCGRTAPMSPGYGHPTSTQGHEKQPLGGSTPTATIKKKRPAPPAGSRSAAPDHPAPNDRPTYLRRDNEPRRRLCRRQPQRLRPHIRAEQQQQRRLPEMRPLHQTRRARLAPIPRWAILPRMRCLADDRESLTGKSVPRSAGGEDPSSATVTRAAGEPQALRGNMSSDRENDFVYLQIRARDAGQALGKSILINVISGQPSLINWKFEAHCFTGDTDSVLISRAFQLYVNVDPARDALSGRDRDEAEAALSDLDSRLIADGWEPVGRFPWEPGQPDGPWYGHRYRMTQDRFTAIAHTYPRSGQLGSPSHRILPWVVAGAGLAALAVAAIILSRGGGSAPQ